MAQEPVTVEFDDVATRAPARVRWLLLRALVGSMALLIAGWGDPVPPGPRWGLAGAAVALLAIGGRFGSPATEVGLGFAGAWSVFLVWLGTSSGVSDLGRMQFLGFGVLTMIGVVVMGTSHAQVARDGA